HVIPASPNTLLAYLQVIALGVRGLAMQERTRELQQGIAAVRREFERFVELHDQLGRHLDNATKKFDETDRALSRASGAIETLAHSSQRSPRFARPTVSLPSPRDSSSPDSPSGRSSSRRGRCALRVSLAGRGFRRGEDTYRPGRRRARGRARPAGPRDPRTSR